MAVVLNSTQVPTVVATSPQVDRTRRISASVMRSRKCPASMTPPKIIAERISHTVFNIPAIPREVNSESICAFPRLGCDRSVHRAKNGFIGSSRGQRMHHRSANRSTRAGKSPHKSPPQGFR